jgi:hypothetical protein
MKLGWITSAYREQTDLALAGRTDSIKYYLFVELILFQLMHFVVQSTNDVWPSLSSGSMAYGFIFTMLIACLDPQQGQCTQSQQGLP